MRLLILNGPNLNLLGKRETEIYGKVSFDAYLEKLKQEFPDIEFIMHQSNIEGELIDFLHRYGLKDSAQRVDGIIFNPAGYSHTSVALADAIAALIVPVVEAHISNLHAREEYRHQSLTGARCVGIISGFGLDSYKLAVLSFSRQPA